MPDILRLDAAVHLDVKRKSATVCLGAQRGDLRERFFNQPLPAEARLHGHDKRHVDFVKPREQRLRRGIRLDRHADAHARRTNGVNRRAEVTARLDMHGEDVRARLCKIRNVADRLVDHQMHVKGQLCRGARTFDDRCAEREIRNKSTVHDVQMNEIGACRIDCGTFVIELCKVCGQNRGGNLNHMYSFAVAELPCRHILLIAKIPSAAAAGMKKTKTCINKRRGGKRSDTGCESSPIRSAQHVYSIKIS